MIGYALKNGRLTAVSDPIKELDRLVWVDLFRSEPGEIRQLEELLDFQIPTRDEMEEIEISSRLYEDSDTHYLTITLPARAGQADAEMAPVSFVLTDWLLVTVRSTEPRAFHTFPIRAGQADLGLDGPATLLLALLEAIVDRIADLLETTAREIDDISSSIFDRSAFARGSDAGGKSSFQQLLGRLGRVGDLLSDLRESLMTLARAAGYLAMIWPRLKDAPQDERERLQTLGRDVQSISEHASFLTQKVTFLLDATLGMISIEQNATIKIFSVLAVVLLPPTMVASIYGMNFQHMPELSLPWGYPLALLMMLATAVLPYWWFKRKGWL